MKLNTQQIASVKQEIGAEPVEEANPAMEPLRNAFGDHTFYVGSEGLFVLEPVDAGGEQDAPSETAGQGASDLGEPAQLVLIASWANEEKNALQPVPAQATDKVIDLAAARAAKNGSGGTA